MAVQIRIRNPFTQTITIGVGVVALFAGVGLYTRWDQSKPVATVRTEDSARQVYFSPDGGCTEAVVAELSKAKSTVYVQAYSFSSAPIAQALVDAHKRGVVVQVILDKSQRTERYSSADFVAHAGIPTFIDAQHAIAHNKIIIIDGAVVLTEETAQQRR